MRRDELLAVVRLYKALGGGWQEAAPERQVARRMAPGALIRAFPRWRRG
jgi:hypothetical protein